MKNKEIIELSEDVYRFLETDAGKYLWSIIRKQLDLEIELMMIPLEKEIDINSQFIFREQHLQKACALKEVLAIREDIKLLLDQNTPHVNPS